MQVRVEAVSKIYHDADRTLTILDRVTCSFDAGRSYAIVGASGVGKSTLLHLLAGLDLPSSGAVWIGDTPISRLSPDERARFRGARVGVIFQMHHLLGEFTARENVAMPLIIRGVTAALADEQSVVLLSKVGLEHRLDHLPSALSGGEQQRVAIARALVSDPAIVLADEPTGSLDVATAEVVHELMLRLSRERGTTLVVVTHNRALAERFDQVVEMLPGGELRM